MTNPQKKHLNYTIRDFYKDYSKEINKQKKYKKRDYIKYRDFIFSVFAELFYYILHKGWHFVLPYSLGEFYLKESTKNTGNRVYSLPQSIKARKAVYIFNNHTLRKTFKFVWDKSYVNFPTAKYYKFELIDGREKLHKKYKVGRAAISEFLFSVGTDPKIKVPNPINKPERILQEPK